MSFPLLRAFGAKPGGNFYPILSAVVLEVQDPNKKLCELI